MNVNDFVPKEAVKALGWLWKQKGWWKPRYTCFGCEGLGLIVPPADKTVDPASYRFLCAWVDGCKKAHALGIQSIGELATIYSCARVVGEGPKVFFPIDEQCEAMLNTEIDIPKSYYKQPYPAFVVKFPWAFTARHAALSKAGRFPTFAMAVENDKGIFINSQYDGAYEGMVNIITLNTPGTIEQAVTTKNNIIGSVEEYTDNETCQRLALNFAMMLTNFKHLLGYRDTAQAEAINKKLEKKPAPLVRMALHEQRKALVQEIIPDQETVFFTREDSAKGSMEGHHATPRPHWRRGHWRREAGYREIITEGKLPKIIFIRPVLVNAGRAGEGGTFPVSYRPRSPKGDGTGFMPLLVPPVCVPPAPAV